MPLKLESPPLREDVLDKNRRDGSRFTSTWERWWQRLLDSVSTRPQIVSTVALVSQAGNYGPVAFRVPEALPAGLYRITYQRSPATLPFGGQLNVAVTWTSGGALQQWDMDGGSDTLLMQVDAGTDIEYSVSHLVPPPTWDLYLVLERLT